MATASMDRIAGGLVGLLVGDAIGASYEFRPSVELPPLQSLEMTPPSGFAKTHRIPDGTWTDDGSQALVLLESLFEAGATDDHSNGSGSLMWVLPLALWHRGSDDELVRDARDQSRVTHGHARSQLICALCCLWARELLAGRRRNTSRPR